MRTVTQRVSQASVTIDGKVNSAIRQGLVVLIGIEDSDNQDDIDWMIKKIIHLRVFDDENGVMNRSILDIDGDIMVVSQFTLHASTRKGNRPSYIRASKSDIAIPLYEAFCGDLRRFLGKEIATGVFGADMSLNLTNDGPVTIIIDSKLKE